MVYKFVLHLLMPALLLTAFNVQGQAGQDVFADLQAGKPGQGNVIIRQNADITNMVNLHISLMRSLKGIKGYRVCIYYNSGQEANKGADQERAKFISKYEDVRCYKTFESPFFKVYAGDF